MHPLKMQFQKHPHIPSNREYTGKTIYDLLYFFLTGEISTVKNKCPIGK